MSIIRDKTKGTLRLSQEKYIGKVLDKFNMKDAKARCQPLGDHFKLSKIQAPKTEASRQKWLRKGALGSCQVAVTLLEKCVAMSITEAEYMAIAEAGKELKILGAKNPADMLTKVVMTEKLKLCAASTSLRDN
ncbi:hypothetical protein Tco_0007636 [Tanacetum coccineum]